MRFSLKHDDATGAAQAPSFDVPVVVSTSKRFHTWFPFGGARVGDSIAVMHQVRILTEIQDDFRRFVDEISAILDGILFGQSVYVKPWIGTMLATIVWDALIGAQMPLGSCATVGIYL